MKDLIIQKAKEDLPLYFEDFRKFWDDTEFQISDDDLYQVYLATLVFKNWKISFKTIDINGFDQIIDELYEDINSSLFLAVLGLYRSAHMHMRSSIELTLQLIYFIHHPIEFKKWQEGDFVIKHSDLAQYIIEHPNFGPEVKQLMENITRSWKHFSKHIHGESPIFFQCEKDIRKTNSFSQRDFGIWKSNHIKVIYKLNKLMIFFFKSELNRIPETSRKIFMELLKEDDINLLLDN